MGWPKGQKRGVKNGGRQKGTPNKNKVSLLEEFEKRNFDVVSAFIESLAAQPEYMRCDTLLKAFEYLFPKKKAEEVTVGGSLVTVSPNGLSQKDMIEVIRAARSGKEE